MEKLIYRPWEPTSEEAKYLNLIMSMCLDCLMNKGTKDRKTFISNLKLIADRMYDMD